MSSADSHVSFTWGALVLYVACCGYATLVVDPTSCPYQRGGCNTRSLLLDRIVVLANRPTALGPKVPNIALTAHQVRLVAIR